MATNFEKLQKLLEELFQLDQADLDFGIYRIMNQKRDEVVRFLEKDLLPQVKEAFSQYRSADKAGLQEELDKAIEQAKGLGVEPEGLPKVQELRQKMADSSVDVTALENEVFSHLFNFFRRYYHEGDFISLRRYKEGVYAIPYEGEEVKLHWANHDQYYVKSSEYFRDYIFTMPSGKRVRVHLVAASSEQDNKKEQSGKERRFIICEEDPVYEENGELFIRFEYRPDDGKKKQDTLNQEAMERVLQSKGFEEWIHELAKPAPTKANPKRTVFEKHLTQYTARNTFDYFIHKDLGGFLRRELDFYIKNEVMHLDDIEHDTVPRVEQYLSKIKVIRKIAHKVIQFLEQLENFQKKLWLKKKFVVETNYCVTLDRVPEELYEEIASNEEQRKEWVRLFAIQEVKGYTEPLKIEFLKSNQALFLDTQFFNGAFKDRLISTIDSLSAETNGLLVRSENFQALSLFQSGLSGTVKCCYLDPPYNTNVSAIPYKNNYRHSSWGTLMHDRLRLLAPLLRENGVCFVSIDKAERSMLQYALDSAFGSDNRVEELIWVQNTNDGRSPTYSTNHEYVEVYARNKDAAEADIRIFREPKPGFVEVSELVAEMNPRYPAIEEIQARLGELYRDNRKAFKEEVERQGLIWEVEKKNDPWNGIYQYKFAEYRDAEGRWIAESEARSRQGKIWIYNESDWTIMSSESKQSGTTRDPEHPNYRYYEPLHPITGKACAMPSRGWKGTEKIDPKHPNRNSMESLVADNRIAFGPDESKVPRQKKFLHEVSTNVAKSVFSEYADGEKETTALFGRAGVFLAPKHTKFVKRFLRQVLNTRETVLDCFGGSGSTGHAVIDYCHEQEIEAKYVLVEVNEYFETVLKPRILKGVYSSQWKDGKPTTRDGKTHIIKYLRLESYEDALNNLELKRNEQQQGLLEHDQELREQYTLSYMLDVESRESQSLLNVDAFRRPDEYKLRVERNGETKLVKVDLVETFSWLLGLTVKHIDVIRGVRVIEGTNPEGAKVLVLWRNLDETNNDALDAWFKKQGYNTKDQEYDLIYVNGDNNLENLCREDQTWKVRLIEEEFGRLMFDVEDV